MRFNRERFLEIYGDLDVFCEFVKKRFDVKMFQGHGDVDFSLMLPQKLDIKVWGGSVASEKEEDGIVALVVYKDDSICFDFFYESEYFLNDEFVVLGMGLDLEFIKFLILEDIIW